MFFGFSAIDQCKLTTTIFLYHLVYCIVSKMALVQVLAPEETELAPMSSSDANVEHAKSTK
jgi:hypothetical protein